MESNMESILKREYDAYIEQAHEEHDFRSKMRLFAKANQVYLKYQKISRNRREHERQH